MGGVKLDIEKELAEILSESISVPFLFISSGFSRRYYVVV